MFEIGLIGFLNPWLLLGVLSFPIIWIILRITPPSPKRVTFPAFRLLLGLQGTTSKPQKTAWWLILLRLLILLFVILALAEPIYAPQERSDSNLNTLVLLDNDWASVKSWPKQIQTLKSLLKQNKGSDKKVAILTTAPDTKGKFDFSGFKDPESLLIDLQQIAPIRSWNSDHVAALKSINEIIKAQRPLTVVWLSNGIILPTQLTKLNNLLENIGEIELHSPVNNRLPLWIKNVEPDFEGLTVTVQRVGNTANSPQKIVALSDRNDVLASESLAFNEGETSASAILKLPTELSNKVQKIAISGTDSAATTYLMDQSDYRFPVGLLTTSGQEDNKSLLGEHYYLQRALSLFTDVRYGTLQQLLTRELSTIVVTDNEPIDSSDSETLSSWIAKGGLLLRFSGPNLASNKDEFVSVPLRSGFRNLTGSLTWEQPLSIEKFDKKSPLFGLIINKEITVSGQLLAQPTPELDQHTWARLQDGTPLITAKKQGQGFIVLVHTSANTRWSNLALSGLFVDMLKRILQFGQGVGEAANPEKTYPIHDLLDAYGTLNPVEDKDLILAEGNNPDGREFTATPQTPPGYYGEHERVKAVNLAGSLPDFQLNNYDATRKHTYGTKTESPLQVPLLLSALILFLLDQVLTLWLRGVFSNIAFRKSTAVLLFVTTLSALSSPIESLAQESGEVLNAKAIEATLNTYLAYVITGNSKVDSDSHAGLAGLSLQLHRRTAVEYVKVTGVDLDRDQLSPYPLLYWPITATQEPLTSRGKKQLNQFISNGGLILFDLREASGTLNTALGTQGNAQYLQELTSGIEIPELEPLPAGHVMTKAFYLLETFPGRNNNRDFWTERTDKYRNDGVARILIGSNDWSRAWAVNDEGRPLYTMIRGGERQRELSYRFGINLVMYALTGNYKEDQVHIPHILERLGQ